MTLFKDFISGLSFIKKLFVLASSKKIINPDSQKILEWKIQAEKRYLAGENGTSGFGSARK